MPRKKPPTAAEAEALEQRAAALEAENGRLLSALGDVRAGAARSAVAAGSVSGILTEVRLTLMLISKFRTAYVILSVASMQ